MRENGHRSAPAPASTLELQDDLTLQERVEQMNNLILSLARSVEHLNRALRALNE